MINQEAMLDVVGEYARTTARRYDVGEVLDRLAIAAVQVLGVHAAGISIAEDTELRVVAATAAEVVLKEELQIQESQGPGVEAIVTGRAVAAADLDSDRRWANYRKQVLELGCSAVAAVPMTVDGETFGAMTIYAQACREWQPDELRVARVLADLATGYIVNVRDVHGAQETAKRLQGALRSTVVIEQAKGILAERNAIDPAAAFEKLRRYSRDRNLKVHDVARGIIDGTLSC